MHKRVLSLLSQYRKLVYVFTTLSIIAVLLGINYLKDDGYSTAKVPEGFQNEVFIQEQKVKAATYYVSNTGNNSHTGKTQEDPLKTINHALRLAQPGEVIELASGMYHEAVKTFRPGTKDSPIVLRGSHEAVLKGAANSNRVIEINHSYIWLEGFSVNGKVNDKKTKESYRDKLVYIVSKIKGVGVEGVRLTGLKLENAGGECVRLRYFAKHNELSDLTIKNCGIYDFVLNEGGKNGEGIYIGTAPEQLADGKNPSPEPDTSENNWIHHNRIETNGNECVDIKESSKENLIENNTCSGQKDPESGGLDARGNKNTFRYNLITNVKGAGIRLGGDNENQGINNEVYQNIIKNTGGFGIKIMRSPQSRICANVFQDIAASQIGGDFKVAIEDIC